MAYRDGALPQPILFAALVFGFTMPSWGQQGIQMPDGFQAATPAPSAAPPPSTSPTPPSFSNNPVPTTNAVASPPSLARAPVANSKPRSGELPNEAGQIWRDYDLTPYTGYLTTNPKPHQAIIDWILRETGTDLWFTEPFGILSAQRDTLRVYHTPEMHAVVQEVLDRFIGGTKDPQVLSLKILTVSSPNWRARANPLIQHVNVQSPGVQAWLVSKENAAVLMSMFRARNDAKELQAADIVIHNGQRERIGSTRSRNYVRAVRPNANGWPPYEPETGQAMEGFELEVSPLLAIDGRSIDVVLKCSVDQVEKLVPVDLDLPLPNGQNHRMRIEVPQVVSWRLHERFRWPSDQVLLLSCGVVAAPDRPNPNALINLDRLVGNSAGRADALLVLEWRGRATDNVLSTPQPQATSAGLSISRGRY